MDMKFKTTKEYKKIKRDFIKGIFGLSLVCFFGYIISFCFLSFFIYCSILNCGKDFPHFVLAIFMSVYAFISIIFLIIMHIKYIFEFKYETFVENMNIGILGTGTMLIRPVREGDDKIE